jgi:DNA-binding PadR family transcriptional regulator
MMTKSRSVLTELEGAILGVLVRAPAATAYRVRRLFQESRSAEWSGSAGAVYPAIRRLVAERMIKVHAESDGRGTHTYELTPAGQSVYERWLCDVARAIGPGVDPFRTRAPLWIGLPAATRRKLAKELKAALEEQRESLFEQLQSLDEDDAIGTRLHIALLDLRLKWLADQAP